MNDVLAPAGRQALAAFVRPGTLVALDLDGTLSPIVARPAEATIGEGTRDLVTRLARRFPVIIVTGRSRTDALRILGGAPVLEVIGSHGLETPGAAIQRFVGRVARWRAQLNGALRVLSGVSIEDKRYSLAVHYRQADNPPAALREIEQVAGTLEGARVLGGHKVVNFVPREAPGKGTALLAACERLGCSRAVYAGDDETDEDVFSLRAPGRVFSVRVGHSIASAAPWYLRSQEQIDDLLQALLDQGR